MNRAAHAAFLVLAGALAQGVARSQTTELVSVDSSGGQANYGSQLPSVSPDGRFIVFWSNASNLVPNDTNTFGDVFVRDRQSGMTECVSLDPAGIPGNGTSGDYPQSISADGRFVAFTSTASNLVAGDTNAWSDIFVRDRQNGTTARVSLSVFGTQSNSYSFSPVISADGRFVAFSSNATNLVVGDYNAVQDIFVRDLQSGTNELVSVSTAGTQGSWMSAGPCAISADGRYVAFWSAAPDLVAGDTNGYPDIFRRDRLTGTTERVSISTSGVQGDNDCQRSSISADGRFVAFISYASTLDPTDTNGVADVFVRDMQNGTTERVSVATSGAQGDGNCDDPSVSDDGRYVSFSSEASTLVPGDTNGFADIFLRDRQSGTTERVSTGLNGAQPDQWSRYPAMSPDGRFVAFSSGAENLVAGDANQREDIFLFDRSPSVPPTAFCFGDGTGTACPCGNGAAGNGCPSSVNPNGANLAASGNARLGNDTLALLGSGMPDSTCLYFQGMTQIDVVFGDGLRCAGGSIARLGRKTNVQGASQYPAGTDPSVSSKGNVSVPGSRTYQVWYRNAAAFCTSATFNLTNGLLVTWVQ